MSAGLGHRAEGAAVRVDTQMGSGLWVCGQGSESGGHGSEFKMFGFDGAKEPTMNPFPPTLLKHNPPQDP